MPGINDTTSTSAPFVLLNMEGNTPVRRKAQKSRNLSASDQADRLHPVPRHQDATGLGIRQRTVGRAALAQLGDADVDEAALLIS